ncbi:hypothetical protein [Lysinibacillus odysseyi]|nr:hypothetical protein [Lysinibacillus odysseyi]
MEFNLEQLKMIHFWSNVAKGEFTLDDEHEKLIREIEEYLKSWGEI